MNAMISALSDFDKMTAAGILARAALAILDNDNPAVTPVIPREAELREVIIEELRKSLGVSLDDRSPATLARIGDLLDHESDLLIGPVDSEAALRRLSEKGELPSDLFRIRIIPNIQEFHGKKFQREQELIEQTVRLPDKEQHFGPAANPGEPYLISLFAKYFPNQYALRSFTMLVVGKRNDLELEVHQAWRIYHDLVSLEGVSDLIELLRRFADKFGSEIELGGKRGHFILSADLPRDKPVEFGVTAREPDQERKETKKRITFSFFVQRNPLGSDNQAALAVGVDLSQYAALLKSRGW